jgi:hypothetical protein
MMVMFLILFLVIASLCLNSHLPTRHYHSFIVPIETLVGHIVEKDALCIISIDSIY